MMPLRALTVVVGFVMVSAGSYIWTIHTAVEEMIAYPRAATPSVLDDLVNGALVGHDVVNGVAKRERARRNDWIEPHVDLYGNEIDDAVGDYRVDDRGELYERHAPDTAVLRLRSPRL